MSVPRADWVSLARIHRRVPVRGAHPRTERGNPYTVRLRLWHHCCNFMLRETSQTVCENRRGDG